MAPARHAFEVRVIKTTRRPHPGSAAGGGRRQGSVHQGAGGGPAGRRDRPRRAFHEGHADAAAGGPGRSPACCRARTCAMPSSAARSPRWSICRRVRWWRPRRCAGRRRCCMCGPTSRSCRCAATSRRGCANWRKASPTRRCSPARGCAASGSPIASRRPSRPIRCCPPWRRAPSASRSAAGTRRWPSLLSPINDEPTALAVTAERAFLAKLEGSCRTPIAGLAELGGGRLVFRGMILTPDGREAHATRREGRPEEALRLAEDAAAELLAKAGPDFFSAHA